MLATSTHSKPHLATLRDNLCNPTYRLSNDFQAARCIDRADDQAAPQSLSNGCTAILLLANVVTRSFDGLDGAEATINASRLCPPPGWRTFWKDGHHPPITPWCPLARFDTYIVYQDKPVQQRGTRLRTSQCASLTFLLLEQKRSDTQTFQLSHQQQLLHTEF